MRPLHPTQYPQFAYPFTLEPHIITLESSRRTTQAAHAARREAYLLAREEEKERRKRDKLRKVAPGFEPSGAMLVPVHLGGSKGMPSDTLGESSVMSSSQVTERDVMGDLVDQLAAMESKSPG